MQRITSRQNSVVARYRSAALGDDDMLLLDGPHLIKEALSAGIAPTHLMVTADAMAKADIAALLTAADDLGVEIASVNASVMGAASPVRTPAGIVAIAKRPARPNDKLYSGRKPLVLIACDVQDPGNMGAIVRVAEAAGASGVVAAGSCADPFGWKALRGSMGSALRLPVVVEARTEQAIDEARRHRCRIAAAVPRDGVSMFEARLAPPLAILIGGEGPGLPQSLLEGADTRVTIPMQAPVESLNAAVTAALLLYQVQQAHSR
jgi:TrmH family RNA methyltransferase